MKKAISILIALSLVLTMLSGITLSAGAEEITFEGAGNATNPYIISSDAHFAAITNLKAYYKVTSDITVTAPLAGNFSGQIVGDKGNGEKPVITLDITSQSANTGFVANLYGENALIDNFIFEGEINSTSNDVGAAAGLLTNGKITNCINKATISGNLRVGGIAGWLKSGLIQSCSNRASVTSSTTHSGGITAYNGGGKITECYNAGDITANGGTSYAAGICPFNSAGAGKTIEISECYNSGNIYGNGDAAGSNSGVAFYFAGVDTATVIFKNNYNIGSVIANGSGNANVLPYVIYAGKQVDDYSANTNVTLSGNYYLSSLKKWVDVSNILSVSDAELSSLSKLGFNSSTWFTDDSEDAYYPYPQLNSNPMEFPDRLSAPENASVAADGSSIILTYDEVSGATGYEAKVYQGETLKGTLTSETTSIDLSSVITAYGSYTVKVKAIGDGINNIDSVYASINYANVEPGTDENPYIISSQAQFDAITDFTKVYKIATDLTVTKPLGTVSGKLIGDKGNGEKPVITLNINSTATKAAFVSELNGVNAEISNFIFEGSVVSTSDDASAIAAYLTNGKITKCINKATVSGGTRVAGIAARASAGTQIELCANLASVTANQTTAGGITAYNTGAVIKKCYNSGTINALTPNDRGYTYASGISGWNNTTTANIEISDCYNTGTINGEGTSNAGIAYTFTAVTLILKNNYNVGIVNGSGNWNANLTTHKTVDATNIYNNYYLSGINSAYYKDEAAVSVAKTSSELSDLTTLGFDSSVWFVDTSADAVYTYPQLKGLEMSFPERIAAPSNLKIEEAFNGSITLSFDGVTGATGYVTEVYLADNLKGSVNLDAAASTADLTSYMTANGEYTIKVKALADGINNYESVYSSVNFTKATRGTDENPYIIDSDEDFANITDTRAVYKITADITVNAPLKNRASFEGKIIGDKGNNVKPVITLNINDVSANNTGMVGVLASENALIKNLIFEGSVNGAMSTGTAVGSIKQGKVIDCINKATVTGTTYVGGIAGRSEVNANGNALKCEITNCANLGDVTATTHTAGGIIGYGYGYNKIGYVEISECYNSGNVTVTGDTSSNINAGGIAGSVYAGDVVITNCYNSGEITSATTAAAGIVYKIEYVKSLTFSYNYNAGEITAKNGSQWISNLICEAVCTDPTVVPVIKENYYLNTAEYKNLEGIFAVSDEVLSELWSDSSVWAVKENAYGYNYPQLVSNPHDQLAYRIRIVIGRGGYTPDNSKTVSVNYGESADITIKPYLGYKIESVKFNGEIVKEETVGEFIYTTPEITVNSVVEVAFIETIDNVNAISPDTPIVVNSQDGNKIINDSCILAAAKAPAEAGYEITGYGIVISEENASPSIVTCDFDAPSLSELSNDNTFGILLHGNNISSGKTYYIRAYVIYSADGEESTVYGKVSTIEVK